MDPATSSWAKPELARILPLDEESLAQVLDYTWTLPRDEAAEHLKNLLGDAAPALEFISNFNARRAAFVAPAWTTPSAPGPAAPAVAPPKSGKKKGAPPRTKPARPLDQLGTTGSSSGPARPIAATDFLGSALPNVQTRTASPKRGPKSGGGTKATVPGGTPMHGAGTDLADLDAALRSLELITTNPAGADRRCDCMGATHPLLEAAPNCLRCGKVVCVKEGLAPCTFCGAPLLALEQVEAMARALREARGRERMAAHNAAQRPAPGRGPAAVSAAPSGNGGAMAARAAAEAHRDRLLGYQAASAARTTVVDEAAAFETRGGVGWGSAEERAARLRRQQRVLRQLEDAARPEWERRRTVLSVEVVGNKLVKKYVAAPAEAPEEGEEEDGEVARGEAAEAAATGAGEGGTGTFARNPLMGKLVRPVWRPTDTKGKGRATEAAADGQEQAVAEATEVNGEGSSRRRPKSTWRRVQDDAGDDNEKIILDGGARGEAWNGEALMDDVNAEPEALVDEPGYG